METHHQTRHHTRRHGLSRLLVGLMSLPIRLYQYLLSPWLGHHCRFHPTCSHYALEALQIHGPVKGLTLALKRLGRCHPWHSGGPDPVPPSTHSQHKMVHK